MIPPEEIVKLDGVIPTENERFVFMEYTGQNDMNSKEIYEEDIVKVQAPIRGKYKEVVAAVQRFIGGRTFDSAFRIVEKNGRFHEHLLLADIEIIGNLRENPELLK